MMMKIKMKKNYNTIIINNYIQSNINYIIIIVREEEILFIFIIIIIINTYYY